MPEASKKSELWLVRTCFDDDFRWNAIEADARKTRSRLPEATLVVSADHTQCSQRIRRIMTHLAARAQENRRLHVAIADKQTFGHPDQLLLTVDCSTMPRTIAQLPLERLAPRHAFLLGTTDRPSRDGRGPDSDRTPMSRTEREPKTPQATRDNSDLALLVADAIRTGQVWKRAMTRDIPHG
ncbi:DUF6924 domain-containing protein [Rhodococcus sp. P1Y]|uniref:DUF6924 domain-containing protein n=1 Tax=Rhodococcus sp. P1Y TaxID=1302308 RepID=UPI000EAE21E5|nr:hypothetical protein [Rhodococcus sp. P1Y]AYJ48940.1 hypothetical protein D8W71_11980 [Rhodococcus sp. P1Y]